MGTLVGSYETVARMLDQVADVVGTNGIMLVFDDFLAGIENFGTRIQPLKKSRNVAPAEAWAPHRPERCWPPRNQPVVVTGGDAFAWAGARLAHRELR